MTIEPGDPIVSTQIMNSKLEFIPFVFVPVYDPNYARMPSGGKKVGSVSLDTCYPYGAINGKYAQPNFQTTESIRQFNEWQAKQ